MSAINQAKVYQDFECPTCFVTYYREAEDRLIDISPINMLCRFCLAKIKEGNYTSKELLMRRLDIIEDANPKHVKTVLKHLAKHVDIREIDVKEVETKKVA